MLLVLLIFHSFLLSIVQPCYISGTDSGYCSEQTLDFKYRAAAMPFCGRYIEYPACLPKEQKIPPSRQWPAGRWFNHTTITKDNWLAKNAREHLYYRRDLERNKTLYQLGINEYGEAKPIYRYRFWHKNDCKYAYFGLFCWINFPRCDMDRLISLPTCRSACENYFLACGFEEDIWRCGKPKFYNGYSPETPSGFDEESGAPIYLRDYFPGSPFRANKFENDGLTDRPICTPAMKGAGSRMGTVPELFSMTSILTIVISYVLLVTSIV